MSYSTFSNFRNCSLGLAATHLISTITFPVSFWSSILKIRRWLESTGGIQYLRKFYFGEHLFHFLCLSIANITSVEGLHTCQKPKDFMQSQALQVISQLATARRPVPNIFSFDRKLILSLTLACPSDWKLLLTSIQICSDSWRSLRLLVLAPRC